MPPTGFEPAMLFRLTSREKFALLMFAALLALGILGMAILR